VRKVTIVGAGQSGLMIGVGLVRKGYDITIVSDKKPEEIRNGRVSSSQGFQTTPIAYERKIGLRLWEQDYKPWEGIEFNILNPETKEKQLSFSSLISEVHGRPDWVVESIDQRVKMPAWIYKFEELGGKMLYETADLASLERYEADADLVLVASGKGEIGALLERDDEKSVFDKPQRAIGMAYVKNMKPILTRDNGTIHRGFTWNAVPGVGEYFVCNALTTSGECEIMIFEGIPGGPMDILDMRDGPEKFLENCLKLLKEFLPDEYERAKDCYLTDDLGILSGRFPPTIRKPVMKLPNGGLAMGVADAVCLNDPVTGQGSCNAAKFANVAIDAIIKHGYRDFDEVFMQSMFDTYWNEAKAVVEWTNSMLGEPKPAQIKLMTAADQNQAVADFLIRGMDDANILTPYWFDEEAVDKLIAKVSDR
jgi:hypothetical protein